MRAQAPQSLGTHSEALNCARNKDLLVVRGERREVLRLPIIAMIILASGLVVTQLVTISTATSVKLGSSDDSWIEHQNPDIVWRSLGPWV